MASQVVQKRMNQGIQPLESKTTKTLISQKRLEGKVAIVTGGAKGIGEETVKLFVQHGAKVVIADIDDTAGQALANSLAPSVTFTHCDVTSENDIQNLITSTVSKHGHLDILFNNAGLLGSQTRNKMSIVDFDVEELNRLLSVNLRGMALGMKHAARVMIPQGHGCIISAASIAGILGGLGSHAYTASKHAIIGLMKNVSGELGKYGIRVNCISPYGVVTQMTVNAWKEALDHEEGLMDESDQSSSNASSISGEMVEQMEMFMSSMGNLKGATLKAKDIAEAAVYLASDESKYVSGHNLVVDGGITASKILSAL